MNEELHFLYKELPLLDQKNIYHTFEKAEKTKRLIKILETKGKYFSTAYAVANIYEEEMTTVDFKTLVNRFYKLRKELKDWLLQQLKNSPVALAEAEKELMFMRQLVAINEYHQAEQRLVDLEKVCWDSNLFEILYQVIELRIKCVQFTFGVNYAKQQKLLEDYQLAFKLLGVLVQLKTMGYGVAYKSMVEKELTMNKTLKMLRKYKMYPRFKKVYHYIIFSVNYASIDINKQTLSRHLSSFRSITDANPTLPNIFLQKDYQQKDMLYFSIKEASFYANRNEIEKALCIVKEVVETEKATDVYLIKNTGYLYNIYFIGLCATDYDFAYQQLETYQQFIESNPIDSNDLPFDVIQLGFYCQAFPYYTVAQKDLEKLLLTSLDYEQKIKDTLYRGLRQIAHFQLYVITQQWQKASAVLDNQHSLAFHAEYGQDFDFRAFFHQILHLIQHKDATEWSRFKQSFAKERKRLKTKVPPLFLSWFNWTEQVCAYYYTS